MMGTSLHTLVQMVDNGLGVTFVPGHGDRGRNPRRAPASTRSRSVRSRLPPDRADLAPLEPARRRVPAARRNAPPDRRRPYSAIEPPSSRRAEPSCAALSRPGRLGTSARRPATLRVKSKRSAFITLVQAATKSLHELLAGIGRGIDFGQGAELRVGAERQVGAGRRPLLLVGLRGRCRRRPRRRCRRPASTPCPCRAG